MFTQKVLNKTSDHIKSSASLTDAQKTLLGEMKLEAGVQCILRMWNNYSFDQIAQGFLCNPAWDDVYCWPPIPAGTVVKRLCSEAFYNMNPYFASHMEGNAKRICLENGTWAEGRKSDFTECRESHEVFVKQIEDDKFLVPVVQNMLFYGSIISLLFLGLSLLIFYCYRCLWCDRLVVNVHLMLSLVLRFIIMFIIAEPFVLGRYPNYKDVEILCESILVAFFYTTSASIGWMFIQGLYLNISLSAKIFPGGNTPAHLKIYYIIGWVVPAGITMAYVVAMVFKEHQGKCWKGHSEMDEMWILLVPIIFALAVNALFLVNILRILLKKVRNSRTENSQVKAAAKAVALLFPVLGMNNLIVLYNPGGDYNKFFVTINTFFTSTQGIFVAIVHCFTNKEVIAAIRRSIDRINARREANIIRPNTNWQFDQEGGFSSIMMGNRTDPQRRDESGCMPLEQPL